MLPSLKTLNWSRFLARPRLAAPAPRLLDRLRHTSVLVVGAGGSIGSALALRLAAFAPPALVLLEASESNLCALQREFEDAGLAGGVKFVLGSAADRALAEGIFAAHAPALVFHAAAFKHVPLLEGQPFAAIENNVFGTVALAGAARGARIILLSTDKAAAPASIMGATKRVAEQVVLAAGGIALRLGNVLASRDSVAEVFAAQIAAGGPLTVTDPAAQRYFITIDEAVDLLLAAALELDAPAVLAPVLPRPHRVLDLARFMACELAPARDLPMEITGLRPGDKEAEQFWTEREAVRPAASECLLRIESQTTGGESLQRALAELRSALDRRDLSRAIACIRRLVPDYTPGAALRELSDESKPQVVA